jgi:hypothetical protein
MDSKSLLETLCNQMSLVMIYSTISFVLDLVNLFAVYKITTMLWRNQGPCFVALKSIILIVYNLLPLGNSKSFLHSVRHNIICKIGIANNIVSVLL